MSEEVAMPPVPVAVNTIAESSNAVAFEVIYKEPEITSPARPPSPPKKEQPQTREVIEQKLKEAAERREAELKKIEEKLAKERQREKEILEKQKLEEEKQKEEMAKIIEQKLQEAQEKREALINDVTEKMKEHAKQVEEKKEKVKRDRENGLCTDCRHVAEPSTITPRQPAETETC